MRYSYLIEGTHEARMKVYLPYPTVISATVSGEVRRFELANLLRHPDQGVLELPRHV